MAVVIGLLRAVNVGGHNKIKMDALRTLCESLELEGAQTYVQSGNVVFKTKERKLPVLAKRMEDAIEGQFGFRPSVILRTSAELRDVIARNPFAGRDDVESNKLVVNFLASDPGEEARAKVRAINAEPEDMRIDGREIYIYFPNGQGKTKLSWAVVDRALKVAGTARNWNSVTKLLEMAEALEAA